MSTVFVQKRAPLLLAISAGLLLVAVALLSQSSPNLQPAHASVPSILRIKSSIASSITIVASRGTAPGIFEITRTSNGSGTVSIDLPVDWELREVRNGSMSEVKHSSAQDNARTWTLPLLRTLSFAVRQEPSSLSLINTSPVPLSVRTKQVFVLEQRIDDETFLVREQPLKIW